MWGSALGAAHRPQPQCHHARRPVFHTADSRRVVTQSYSQNRKYNLNGQIKAAAFDCCLSRLGRRPVAQNLLPRIPAAAPLFAVAR